MPCPCGHRSLRWCVKRPLCWLVFVENVRMCRILSSEFFFRFLAFLFSWWVFVSSWTPKRQFYLNSIGCARNAWLRHTNETKWRPFRTHTVALKTQYCAIFASRNYCLSAFFVDESRENWYVSTLLYNFCWLWILRKHTPDFVFVYISFWVLAIVFVIHLSLCLFVQLALCITHSKARCALNGSRKRSNCKMAAVIVFILLPLLARF